MWTSALRLLSRGTVLPSHCSPGGLVNPSRHLLAAAASIVPHKPYSSSAEQDPSRKYPPQPPIASDLQKSEISESLDFRNGWNPSSDRGLGKFRATINSIDAQASINSNTEVSIAGRVGDGFSSSPNKFAGRAGDGFASSPNKFSGRVGDDFASSPNKFSGRVGDGFASSPNKFPPSNGAAAKFEKADYGFAGKEQARGGFGDGIRVNAANSPDVKDGGFGDNKGRNFGQGNSQGGTFNAEGGNFKYRSGGSGGWSGQGLETSFKQHADSQQTRASEGKFAYNGDHSPAAGNSRNFFAQGKSYQPTFNQGQFLPESTNARNDDEGLVVRKDVGFGHSNDVGGNGINQEMRSRDKLPHQGPGNAGRFSADMGDAHRFHEPAQDVRSQRQVGADSVKGTDPYSAQSGNFTGHLDPRRSSISHHPAAGEYRGSGGGYNQQWRGGTLEYRSGNSFVDDKGQIQGQVKYNNSNAYPSGPSQSGSLGDFLGRKTEDDFQHNLGQARGRDKGGQFEGSGFEHVQDTNLLYSDKRSRDTLPIGQPGHGDETRSLTESRGGLRYGQTQSYLQDRFEGADAGHYGGTTSYPREVESTGDYRDLRRNSTQYPPERENNGYSVIKETGEFIGRYTQEGGRGNIPPDYRNTSFLTQNQGLINDQGGAYNSGAYRSGFGERGGYEAFWDGNRNSDFGRTSHQSEVDKAAYYEGKGFRTMQANKPNAGQQNYQLGAFAKTKSQQNILGEGDRYGGSTSNIKAEEAYNQFSAGAIGSTDMQRDGASARVGHRSLDKRSPQNTNDYEDFAARPQSRQQMYRGEVPLLQGTLPSSPPDHLQSQTAGESFGIRSQNVLHSPGGFEHKKSDRNGENISLGQLNQSAKFDAKESTTVAASKLAHETVHSQFPVELVENFVGFENTQSNSQTTYVPGNDGSAIGKTDRKTGFPLPQRQSSQANDFSGISSSKAETVKSNTVGSSAQSQPPRIVFARLQNVPKLALKSDILQYFGGLGIQPDDLTVVYDERYHPLYTQIRFNSVKDMRDAQRLVTVKGRLGGRFLKIEPNVKPVEDNHPSLTPAMKLYLGRMLLMVHFPKEGNLEDLLRFFEGYSYDRSCIFYLKSIYQSTPRRKAAINQPNVSFARRVMVGFTSALEALRALREKQGEFCLDEPVELKLIQ